MNDDRDPADWEALTAHLDDVSAFLARYVAFPSISALHAVALWTVHAHVVDAFESTPRLALLSPEKGSGKTRTLEVLELLTPNAVHTVNMSTAALFRLIESKRPTLLLDECDTYLGPRVAKEHEELRGLVNAGHRRGATAYRCVGEASKMYVKSFPAFAAIVLAGIGNLPDTILDRAIVLAMKRRRPGDRVEPFRARTARPAGNAICSRLEQWGKPNREPLGELEVEMPEGITDRPADVWEPLVMLGDAAGGDWSARARAACVELNASRQASEGSLGVRLLTDVRTVFDANGDRIPTETLLERLHAMDEAPWSGFGRPPHPLSPRTLARILRPYEVRPRDVRTVSGTKKGYARDDFYDAWSRYLPALGPEGATGATSAVGPENVGDNKGDASPIGPTASPIPIGTTATSGDVFDEEKYLLTDPELFDVDTPSPLSPLSPTSARATGA